MSIGTKILNKIVSLAQATGGQVEGNKDVTDDTLDFYRTKAALSRRRGRSGRSPKKNRPAGKQ